MMRYFLLILFIGSFSNAGRPVYKDLSLERLVGTSFYIIVANNLKINKFKHECGWDSEEYTIDVVEVLRTEKRSEIKSGQKIKFNPWPNSLTDCEARKKNPSGDSFSAARYKSNLEVNKLKPDTKVIVFLSPAKNGWELVADHAIESIDKKPELLKMMGKP